MKTPLWPAVLLLLCPTPASAASEGSLPLDQIIERHLAARGGSERIRAIRTLVYSGGRYKEYVRALRLDPSEGRAREALDALLEEL